MAPKLCHIVGKEIRQNKYVEFQNECPQGNYGPEEKDKSGEVLEVRIDFKIQTPCTNKNVCRYMAYAI